jgi:hypothetical protein
VQVEGEATVLEAAIKADTDLPGLSHNSHITLKHKQARPLSVWLPSHFLLLDLTRNPRPELVFLIRQNLDIYKILNPQPSTMRAMALLESIKNAQEAIVEVAATSVLSSTDRSRIHSSRLNLPIQDSSTPMCDRPNGMVSFITTMVACITGPPSSNELADTSS